MISVRSGFTEIKLNGGYPISGYAYNTREIFYTDSQNALEINFILVEDTLILSIDILFSTSEIEEKIKNNLAKLNICVSNIVTVSTHTHAAPSIDPKKPLLGEYQVEFEATLVQSVCDAIVKSQWSCAKHIAISTTNLSSIISRRKDTLWRTTKMMPSPRKKINENLKLISFLDDKKKPIFSFLKLPAHNNVMAPTTIHADIYGVARRLLRQESGNQTIICLPGCSGDLKINTSKYFGFFNKFKYRKNFPKLSYKKVETFLSPVINKLIDKANFTEISAPIVNYKKNDIIMSTTEVVYLKKVTIDKLEILITNLEVGDSFCENIINDPFKVLTGYGADVVGYMQEGSDIKRGGYEVDGHLKYFGRESPFVHKDTLLMKNLIDE